MINIPTGKSQGICRNCTRTFSKSSMTRHLNTCLKKEQSGQQLLVLIESRYGPYWVYVTMPRSTSLSQIDSMLRDLWLECCGHMSAFSTSTVSYLDQPEPNSWGKPEKSTTMTLSRAIAGEKSLRYEYDFGSTTELNIRLVGDHVRGLKPGLGIVARNDAPPIDCDQCGQPASTMVFDDWYPAPYCATCREGLEPSEEDYELPIVNSPRIGVCGYGGPSQEP